MRPRVAPSTLVAIVITGPKRPPNIASSNNGTLPWSSNQEPLFFIFIMFCIHGTLFQAVYGNS